MFNEVGCVLLLVKNIIQYYRIYIFKMVPKTAAILLSKMAAVT